MTRAASYHRVSIDRQEETGVGLDTQESATSAYATEHELTIADEHSYREVGSGGTLQRAKLQTLLAAAQRGEFSALICYSVDRLSRDSRHLGYILTLLEDAGVAVRFTTESFADDFQGDLLLAVRGVLGAQERRMIGQRVRDALRQRLAQGLTPRHGPAAFGWAYQPVSDKESILVPCPAEQAIVVRIFSLCAAGWSASAVARLLTEEGIPTPSQSQEKQYGCRAAAWGVSSVTAIVRTSAYRGVRVVNVMRSVKMDRSRKTKAHCVYRPKSENLTLPCSPLVSEDMWWAANRTLDGRRADRTRNDHRPVLLRGLVVCSLCGRTMAVDFSAAGTPAFRCQGRKEMPRCTAAAVPATALTESVWGLVGGALTEPQRIIAAIEQQAARGPDPSLAADLERCRAAIATEDRRVSRFVALLGSDSPNLPVDEITRQMAQATRERERLARDAASLERQQNQHAAQESQLRSLEDHLVERCLQLMMLDFDGQRKLLDDLGVRVVAVRPSDEHPTGVVDVSMSVGIAAMDLSSNSGNTDDRLTFSLM